MNDITRRKFIHTASVAAIGSSVIGLEEICKKPSGRHAVSIVRVRQGNIQDAVQEAIDLLGGIIKLTQGRNNILLKPNLVEPSGISTTKPEVVNAVAQIMLKAGKKVMIGEGSSAAPPFNVKGSEIYRTKKREILDEMQQYIFNELGYTELAESLNIPLINLHSGEIIEVPLRNGLAARSVKIHKKLTDADLVCSIPVMKTHTLALVTLAMKNLIGLYPGTEYYSVRSWLHDRAAERGSEGVAYEVIDINNAVKTGLSVIDATTAMEGDGPSSGTPVDMGLIVAGTSPLATDMVGASLMGFDFNEVPAIKLAHKTGMFPGYMTDIDIRGVSIEECRRKFVRPNIYRWADINKLWGSKEL